MRKDGAFYWVVVHITAKFNDKGETISFIALRKTPGLLTLEEMKDVVLNKNKIGKLRQVLNV
jgi:hypothetical protein